MAVRPTDVQIPSGLSGTTVDKLANLARLITNSVDQPFAAKMTNRVLKTHAKEKNKQPMWVDPPAQTVTDGISLRGPVY